MKGLRHGIIILSGILILVIFAIWISEEKTTETKGDINIKKIFLSTHNKTFKKIIMSDKMSSVTLVNDNGIWRVKEKYNLPALGFKVNYLLSGINSSYIEGPISLNPKKYHIYGLDENVTKKLKYYLADTTAAEFYVGSRTADGVGTYIRTDKVDGVYTATSALWAYFSAKPIDWIERRILIYDYDKIERFVISNSSDSVELKKNGTEVTRADGLNLTLDKNTVSSTLRSVGKIYFDDITKDIPAKDPDIELIADNTTVYLYVYNGRLYIKPAESEFTYILDNIYYYENLIKILAG